MEDHSSEFLVAGFSTGILNLSNILQMCAISFHKIIKKEIGLAIFSLYDYLWKVWIETTNNEYIANTQNEEMLVSTISLFFLFKRLKRVK